MKTARRPEARSKLPVTLENKALTFPHWGHPQDRDTNPLRKAKKFRGEENEKRRNRDKRQWKDFTKIRPIAPGQDRSPSILV